MLELKEYLRTNVKIKEKTKLSPLIFWWFQKNVVSLHQKIKDNSLIT